MSEQNQQPLTISLNIPAIITDGSTVSIDENGNVSLIFFQITNKTEKESIGTGICHLRLGLSQLKELGAVIQNTVAEHEKKAKEAKK